MQPFHFYADAREIVDGRELAERARRAESIGYHGLVIPDHLIPQLSPVPAMATIAAATDRLRIGAFVFNNAFRHPAVLAQDLASLDVLSGGRVDVAMGAGWNKPEYDAVGIPFPSVRERQAKLAEAIAILKGAFADGPFSFAGEHYTITDFDAQPKPVQKPHPPFLIGGGGRRTLELAAREAQIIGLAPRILASGRSDPQSLSWAGTVEKIGWVRDVAGERFEDLELNVYPSGVPVSVTDNALVGGARHRRVPCRQDRRRPDAGRCPRVAAHVHRLGGRARGEVRPPASGARDQLDHGRRDGPRSMPSWSTSPGRRRALPVHGRRAPTGALEPVVDRDTLFGNDSARLGSTRPCSTTRR